MPDRRAIDIADLEPDESTILRLDRARTSGMGNPSWWVTFSDGRRLRTRPNASIGYAIGNPGLREGDTVRITLSPAGKITKLEPIR